MGSAAKRASPLHEPLDHGQAVSRGCHDGRLQRLACRRHEQDAIQPQRLVRVAGGQQVTDVGWIEGAAEDPNSHLLEPTKNVSAQVSSGAPPPTPALDPAESAGATPGQSAAIAASPVYAVRSVTQVSAASGTYFSSGRRYTTTISIKASCATFVIG